ncbi:MAG: sigma-70 family RNA polymerase sigma factor [Opitutaceae bacterium]|nr:sigma-70 family RNA polymerase sigma factor [Opitutaceae bacterium]
MTAPGENDSGTISDEALMAALQRGEDQALATLMHRWELGVKGFLLRLGVPSADVEDVAQDAFVRLYEKRANYRPGAPFKPWILTIAGNLGRNRLRWRFRRREDSIEAMASDRPDGFDVADSATQSAAAVAEQAGVTKEVRSAVEALPDNLRQAVLCVELEEMSHQEAAQIMGCSPKAVETRLYRARQILRSALRSVLA